MGLSQKDCTFREEKKNTKKNHFIHSTNILLILPLHLN